MRGGVILTDADFERMAAEAESGIYPGTPSDWVVRPQGRPRVCDEELVVVTCKATRSQREAMDKKAKQCAESRSEWMRETFAAALTMQHRERGRAMRKPAWVALARATVLAATLAGCGGKPYDTNGDLGFY